jgi:endonuclease YncB( thermonuclease family)
MNNFDEKRKLLENATNDVDLFSLNGKEFTAKVVNIYDGDTCKCVFVLNGELVKFNCRMNGYDTPEIRPRLNVENREEVIEKAKEARDYFKNLVKNKLVNLKCGKFDKYGRLLADIYIGENENRLWINKDMIDKKFGYVYNGGTKKNNF